MSGQLILIPTPIGNLGDFSPRAKEAITACDVLLCEDTRTTGLLLKHYELQAQLESFHAHNEHKKLESIIERIESGQIVGLVSDAGTPGISDPGFLLARACREKGITTTCIPGPTALVTALVQSGLPMERFTFEGFLPLKKGRQTRLKQLVEEPRTMVFYESPHRILKTVTEFEQYFGSDREISVFRELTKKFEEGFHGSIAQVKDKLASATIKGEFVIVLAGLK